LLTEFLHKKQEFRGLGPYEGILPPPDPLYGFVLLPNIPVDKFRVLKLSPQIPNPETALVPSGCAEMMK